jgi:hypothetical protein
VRGIQRAIGEAAGEKLAPIATAVHAPFESQIARWVAKRWMPKLLGVRLKSCKNSWEFNLLSIYRQVLAARAQQLWIDPGNHELTLPDRSWQHEPTSYGQIVAQHKLISYRQVLAARAQQPRTALGTTSSPCHAESGEGIMYRRPRV